MQTAAALPMLHISPPRLAWKGGQQLDNDIAMKALDAGKGSIMSL